MNETLARPEQQSVPQDAPEVVRFVDNIVGEQGVRELMEAGEAALEDPLMQRVGGLLESSDQVGQRATQAADEGNHQEARRLFDISKDIKNNAAKIFGTEAFNQYSGIKHQLDRVERTNSLFFADEVARTIFDEVLGSSTNIEADQSRLPHEFVDEERLGAFARDHQKGLSMTLAFDRDKDPPINIPVGMFVSAVGFESWEEGRNGSKGNEGSQDVIEDYAARETEIPPIDQIYGLVLPDGRLYFVSANSHRTAAAIKKGQPSIPFRGTANIVLLDKVPPQLDERYEQLATEQVAA